MKTEVLIFFKELPKSPQKQFNKAFDLFRKSPGKNLQQERFYNQSGYSKVILENLLYDLKKLHNVTAAQIRVAKTKVVSLPKKDSIFVLALENVATATLEQLLTYFKSKEMDVVVPVMDYPAMKAFVHEKGIITANKKKATLEPLIATYILEESRNVAKGLLEIEKKHHSELESKSHQDAPVFKIEPTAATKEEIFTTAPTEVKEGIKLREEFPFLNELDCPEELHILVGQKLSHYYAYVQAHKALLVVIDPEGENTTPVEMTPEQIKDLAEAAVVNFEVNQLIWKELKHYDEHKEVLGTHPIFEQRIIKQNVDKMATADAVTRKSNLDNYIRRESKKLEKELAVAEKDKIEKKISLWRYEIEMLNAKLGFSE